MHGWNETAPRLSRRRAFGVLLIGVLGAGRPASALDRRPEITVYKDPDCGCCAGWVEHLKRAGFPVRIVETRDLAARKTEFGVPSDLEACHTARLDSYVIEGHVPADAIERLLAERPAAQGLAVPGMPAGSPGMGGRPEPYDVILFGPGPSRRSYMSFVGSSRRPG